MKKSLLFCFLISCFCVVAQKPTTQVAKTASATNKLLWYKGKNVNDSTLVTPKGTVITYAKRRGEVVVKLSAKEDKMMHRVNKELGITKQRQKEIFDIMGLRKSNVMLYPHIKTILKQQDDTKEGYAELVKNTIKLPVDAEDLYAKHFGPSLPDSITKLAAEIESLISDAEKWGLMYQNPPALDMSVCFQCDSVQQKNYANQVNSFIEMFYGKEGAISRKALQLSRRIAMYLEKKPSAEGTPQLQGILTRIDAVKQWALSRLEKKVFILSEKYGKDVSRIELIIKAIITYNRQVQLLSGENSPVFDKLLQQLIGNLNEVDKYLEEQMNKRNYDIVLTGMSLAINIERFKQMLGIENEEDYINNIMKIEQKINAFNRFKVNMELEYNSSWPGECGTSTDDAKAVMEDDFYVSMGFVNCKYGLYIAEQHLEKIPNYHPSRHTTLELKMIKGTMIEKAQNDENKCVTTTLNTAGDKLRPYLPLAKISFCENGESDSLIMVGLNRRMAEKYGQSKLYENITLLFTDNPDPESTGVIDQGNEIIQINNLSQEYEMSAQTRKPSLSEMENMHAITAKKEHLSNNILQVTDVKKQSYILFNASNRDETLIDVETTFTFKNDEDEAFLGKRKVEINVKYKVIHDPLPYKSGTKKK